MSSLTTQSGDDEIRSHLKAREDELMLIYREMDPDVLLAWEEGRLKVAEDLMEYNPTPDFFLGISGYKNRIGTREGACVFLVIDKSDHTGLKQVLEISLANASIHIDDILIFTGTPRSQANKGVTGRVLDLDPVTGEYSMEVPPGQSIGAEASSAKSGTLGMWLPHSSSFITTAHVISSDELLATPYPHEIRRGLEVRSPSNQDAAISRARLVNSRAAKHAHFRRSWFKFLDRLESRAARVMVWSVLESEAALRNYDKREPLRYVGESIAGWRGVVGMADLKGVQKEFWIDVAVVAGDQDRRVNDVNDVDHDKHSWKFDYDALPWKFPKFGENVWKRGRTTGVVPGHVGVSEGVMKVTDPHDEERRYLTTEFYIVPGHRHADEPPYIFSDKGDSGSIIVSSERAAVLGQMFAGSGISEKGVKTDITYFSPSVRIAHAIRLLTGSGIAIPAVEGPPQSFALKQAGGHVGGGAVGRNDGSVESDQGEAVSDVELDVEMGAVGSEAKTRSEVEKEEEETEKKENTASIEDPDIDFAEFPELLELVSDLLKNGGT